MWPQLFLTLSDFMLCLCDRSAELRTFGELSRVVGAFVPFRLRQAFGATRFAAIPVVFLLFAALRLCVRFSLLS
jgi:hypothetical protein